MFKFCLAVFESSVLCFSWNAMVALKKKKKYSSLLILVLYKCFLID